MENLKPAIRLSALLGIVSLGQAQTAYPYTIDTVPKQANSGPVKFLKVKIANEGTIESCAFGDFNGDKVMDIVSGNHWFQGPVFTVKRMFRTLSTADRYTPDDMTVTLDVNGDGYDDVVSGGHNIGVFCYMNPGKGPAPLGGMWVRTVIDAERPPDGRVDTAISAGLPHTLGWHSGGLVDVDGDGKAEELLSTGVRAAEKLTVRWYKVESGLWKKYDTGLKCEQWGSGMGDINGDGRADILCPDAWLEAPVNRATGTWTKRAFVSSICNVKQEPEPKFTNAAGAISGHATQIYAYDVNKDGLNDLLLSSGHANGILWYQQAKSAAGVVTFLERIIDSTWFQSHNLEFKDLDRDGDPDLVSGKRWGGWGPQEKGPNNVYWYELTPGAANPWKRHVISYNEKIGMGNKGDVRDADGDGDLDVLATSGDAGGTNLFLNQSNPVGLAWRKDGAAVSRYYPGLRIAGLRVGAVRFLHPDAGLEGPRDAAGRALGRLEARHGD